MLFRIFQKTKLFLNPVKKSEILMGNCLDFNLGTTLNQIRHGLRTYGGDLSHTFWNGADTYRITVLLDVGGYFVLDCEVLTRKLDQNDQFVWMKRSSANRILKSKIHDMILAGKLTRSPSWKKR